MALYDMRCEACNNEVEVSCPIADRESQSCGTCNNTLTPLFSPPTNIRIPPNWNIAFSDLFGTTSEKDYLKENPNLERLNMSTFRSQKSIRQSRLEKANKEAADIEQAIIANRTLVGNKSGNKKKPIETEVGSMTPDIPHEKV